MKDRSAIGRRNLAKGAELEREVAAALFDLTGIALRRNLRQCQETGLGDLVTDDPAWPFSIECKRRSAGTGCADDWRAQAAASARKAGQLPWWSIGSTGGRSAAPCRWARSARPSATGAQHHPRNGSSAAWTGSPISPAKSWPGRAPPRSRSGGQ